MGESKESLGRILIVDDNKDFLEIFSLKLKQAGFDVATAQGGAEGVEKAKQLKPDLILLDVEMPELNGMETLAKLKEDPTTANIRVVFLTSHGEQDAKERWLDEKFAREAGAADYIQKTADLKSVVAEVEKILAQG